MLRNFADHPAFILILIVLVVVLFGAKRLPDAARSLGRSMRIFKSEVKEMKDDGKPSASTGAPAGAPAGAEGTPVRPLEGRVLDADRDQLRDDDRSAGAPYSDTQRHTA